MAGMDATDTTDTTGVAGIARAFATLMERHRSIRNYKPDPLPDGLVDTVLVQALQGGSSSGNLNLVSVVKTQ
jgi:nitroreductase